MTQRSTSTARKAPSASAEPASTTDPVSAAKAGAASAKRLVLTRGSLRELIAKVLISDSDLDTVALTVTWTP